MTTTNEIFEALSSPSGDDVPVFKFTNPGDRISGVIVQPAKVLPLREYGSDQPKLDRNGNPEKQVMLVLATEQTISDDHDGRWRVFFDKPLLKENAFAALQAAGVDGFAEGDEISVQYVGMRTLKSGRQAKDFAVQYVVAGDPWAGTPEAFNPEVQS